MQIDQISDYLSQVMHTVDTTAAAVNTSNSDSTSSEATSVSFDQLFQSYIDTSEETSSVSTTSYEDLIGLMGGSTSTTSSLSSVVTNEDDRTPLEVAQDAYAEFLSLAADAVSGSSNSTDESILSNNTEDTLSDLTEALNNLSTIMGESESN